MRPARSARGNPVRHSAIAELILLMLTTLAPAAEGTAAEVKTNRTAGMAGSLARHRAIGGGALLQLWRCRPRLTGLPAAMRAELSQKICVILLAAAGPGGAFAAEIGKPYRLESVDLKQRILWGAECLEPAGGGLAFGGQDQEAGDGCAHTRIMEGGAWKSLHAQLRAANPMQPFRDRAWVLRTAAKNLRARVRHYYFDGHPPEEDAGFVKREIAQRQATFSNDLSALIASLRNAEEEAATVAVAHLQRAAQPMADPLKVITADVLRAMADAQIQLELATESLDAEPAPRSILCDPRPRTDGIAYDAKTRLYVVFGGDHMDYLTNDTWVFDSEAGRWSQIHPAGAPPPRANHRLTATGDGKIIMTGGYTYAANTDYVGGQYADLRDGPWTLDLGKRTWSGGDLVAADSRTYRTGPLHSDFFLQGPRPDAAAFEAKLKALPANEWIATDPLFRPKLNRDWGTAVLDPDRDMLLRWSGGHSAHGGTDVPHFHFATNRWELPFPVEFPLGQLYSNTSYPDGFNYNLRPWMTGHTYQNYSYDPPGHLMVKAGRPHHFYLYDPGIGDWIARGEKPAAMSYDSCFYTLTLTATPLGAVCWGQNGKVHRFDHAAMKWNELTLTGDTMPGAEVDNSTIAYDSKRDRVLLFRKPYGEAPYDGRVWSLDLKTRGVTALSPPGMSAAHRFAFIDRCVLDPVSELVLMASYLTDSSAQTLTPAFDCAADRWVTLDLKYKVNKHSDRTERGFPHGRSCGIVHDPKRGLIWGTDTDSQIYVLRLDTRAAQPKPLE